MKKRNRISTYISEKISYNLESQNKTPTSIIKRKYLRIVFKN